MRLDKLLAHCGFGTRKEVREMIKNKAVTVDNKDITKPNVKVDPFSQEIKIYGEIVHYEKYIYLMLHKPPGYISATKDYYHPTVIDLVPDDFIHYELFPVGRLDIDTEGLLLLTNDGEINHILTSPRKNIFKTYVAKVDGQVDERHVEQFQLGITLDDGYVTKPATLEILKSDAVSEVLLSISEGKFHQVKRMFQAIGMDVIYLKRTRMGELVLDDSLQLGEIRRLTEEEIDYLTSLK